MAKLITGDTIIEMLKMPDESVDFIFADPPYFLQLGGTLARPEGGEVECVNDDWDKFPSREHFQLFTARWLSQAKRLLKPDGALCVMGSYQSIYTVGETLLDLGFWILGDIIWEKSNPMPNFMGNRLTSAHEHIIWAVKNKKARRTFNYDGAKAANDDTQLRDVWLLPVCSKGERLMNADGQKLHSTQKPEALMWKLITLFTNPGDTVLDPFSGTGTTLAVCEKLRRKSIGIDFIADYNKAAAARLAEVKPVAEVSVEPYRRPRPQKVSFLDACLENGFDFANDRLTAGCYEAVVHTDGTIECEGFRGSIHKVASQLNNAQINGWKFWTVNHGKSINNWRIIK